MALIRSPRRVSTRSPRLGLGPPLRSRMQALKAGWPLARGWDQVPALAVAGNATEAWKRAREFEPLVLEG